MTLQQTTTETPKPQTWNTSELGPRQRKTFNDALGRFNWEARTFGEITDYGDGKPLAEHRFGNLKRSDSVALDVTGLVTDAAAALPVTLSSSTTPFASSTQPVNQPGAGGSSQ